ncbi:MAG: metallophosphoesterase [Guyparkeria sp.]
MPRCLFHADSHGESNQLLSVIETEAPDAVFLLGDLELDRPLDEVMSNVQAPVYWIHGNHDTGEERFDFLFGSSFPSIDGRVIEIDGVRVAGLGGVFKESVWYPGRGAPKLRSREECIATAGKGNLWRGGVPRRKRDAIFPAELSGLARQHADVLILHEAPESHRNGFRELGDLARQLGVRTVIHGHHHYDYESELGGGIRVIGLALNGSRLLTLTG